MRGPTRRRQQRPNRRPNHRRQRPLGRAMLDLRAAVWLVKQFWRAARSDIRRARLKARSS